MAFHLAIEISAKRSGERTFGGGNENVQEVVLRRRSSESRVARKRVSKTALDLVIIKLREWKKIKGHLARPATHKSKYKKYRFIVHFGDTLLLVV